MMRFSLFLLAIAASEAFARGTFTNTVGATTATSQSCLTGYTKTSRNGAVPTSTVTFRIKIPKVRITYKNSTPVQTVTPSPVTSTSTVISTLVTTLTEPGGTDTFSTTSTILLTIETTSVLSVTTSTVTETTTISTTSTSVVSTDAGYIPIQVSSGKTNYVAPVKARSIGHARRRPQEVQRIEGRGTPKMCSADYKYPFSVTCTKRVQVEYIVEIIVVKPTITTTLTPATATVTSTSVTTSTLIVAPKASTTLTFSTTSTVAVRNTRLSTATTTTTATAVTAVTVATRLAACDNFALGPRISTGNYLFDFTPQSQGIVSVPTVAGAYECCALCFDTPNCQFSVYSVSGQQCNLYTGSSCPAGQPQSASFSELAESNSLNTIYVNGPCGSLVGSGIRG